MGIGDLDLIDDGDGGGKAVSCSICLEIVADNGDRAWAKLHCGHYFHLGNFFDLNFSNLLVFFYFYCDFLL